MDRAFANLDADGAEHDVEVLPENVEEQDKQMMQIAEVMVNHKSRLRSKLDEVAAGLQVSRRSLQRHVAGISEFMVGVQKDALSNVLRYIRFMTGSGAVTPLLFTHHVKYDETPMRLSTEIDEVGTRTAQITKLFAIEQDWSALLEIHDLQEGDLKHQRNQPPQYMLLQASASPSFRIGASAKAETVLEILNDASVIDRSEVAGAFPDFTRVVETDENPANMRAEKIWLHRALEKGPVQSLHALCSAHRVHSIAQKSWPFFETGTSALISTLKIMSGNGALQAFQRHLQAEIEETLQIVFAPLSEAAQAHRHHIMELFTPPLAEKPRSASTLRIFSTFLLNGDWRHTGHVEHRCLKCCEDKAAFMGKLKIYLPRVMAALTVKVLSRSDWRAWQGSTFFVGYLSGVHSLFQKTFMRTFGGSMAQGLPSEDAPPPADTHDDKTALFRYEFGVNLRKALAFWSQVGCDLNLYLMRSSLVAEVELMAKLLRVTACEDVWKRWVGTGPSA